MIYISLKEPTAPEQGAVWWQKHSLEDAAKDILWERLGNKWVEARTETDKRFDMTCHTYDQMLREINERGERIKRLAEKLKLAYFEGWMDSDETHTGDCDEGWHNRDWDKSRSKRVSEGLE